MATITPVLLAEAITSRRKEPSPRTVRTRQLEQDAAEIARIAESGSAAMITVSEEDLPTGRYLSGLRSALKRRGYEGIVLQKRRNQDQIAAWYARPEDEERLEERRQTGARLGQMAKERGAKARGRTRSRTA